MELLEIRDELPLLFKDKEFIEELKVFQSKMPDKIEITEKILRQKINRTFNRICLKFANMVKAYRKYLLNNGLRSNITSNLKDFFFI